MSPTVFREAGFRFYFFSREETRMHIHVQSSNGEAKFWLEPDIQVAQNHGLSMKELNEAGSLITEDNPALPGETIVVYATGLGLVKPADAQSLVHTGVKYEGPEFNEPLEFVSSLAGGKTANVLATGLKPGMIGIYEVHLELNSGQPTDPLTQVTIAQSQYVSNVVTIPVFNPAAP